jgi:[ribosomal protein S18]-alanine N-acetyltransferase
MDLSISFEKAEISSFLPIAELDRIAWKQNLNSEFIPDGEHVWRLWVEHALVFSAKSADKIIGAILAFPCLTGVYCVHKVFVDQSQRGKGIGSSLFEVLLKEIDAFGVDCFLTVDPLNEAAIRLYAKWGFMEKLFVKGYYRSNEDRYILTRRCKA